jgi:hypothetical protein
MYATPLSVYKGADHLLSSQPPHFPPATPPSPPPPRDPLHDPLLYTRRKKGNPSFSLCKEEEKDAAILDPFWSLSLHRFNPLRHANLTLHSILIQEHLGVDLVELWSHRPRPACSSSSTGSESPFPPTAEVAAEHRVVSTPRRRPREPPGDPLDPLACRLGFPPRRVEPERTMMADRRSRLDRTAGVVPYRFGPGAGDHGPGLRAVPAPSCARAQTRLCRNPADRPRSASDLARIDFFSRRFPLTIFFRSVNFKNL